VRRVVIVVLLTAGLLLAGVPAAQAQSLQQPERGAQLAQADDLQQRGLAGVQAAAQADNVQQRGRRCKTEFGYKYCAFLLVNYTQHTVRAFAELHNLTSNSCCAWIQSVVLLRGGNASEPTEQPGDIAGPGSRVFGWSELHPCEASPQAYRARISVAIGGTIGRILDSNLAETTCGR
jgi:hypothetical protein